MKKEVLGRCPVCSGNNEVTALKCVKCGTELKGEFQLCKFCRLTKRQKHFVEIFIKNRGNIKEIERELGISYPTVRNKLEDVIAALGYTPDSKARINRKEILDKLANGEISREQAVKMLND